MAGGRPWRRPPLPATPGAGRRAWRPRTTPARRPSGAGAALRQSAAELRIVEPDVVLQRVEQRHVRIGVDRVRLAVHVEGYSGHGCMSPYELSGGLAATTACCSLCAAIANCSNSKAS